MECRGVFEIRPERREDRGAVRRVNELAFGQPDEANLVEALRESGAHLPELCLVALEPGGRVVGHIAFSQAQLDSRVPVLALAPMAVDPNWQGRGAGSALVREGLRRAAETESALVAVVGHATYYPRFGFEPGERHGITAPFEVPSEAWMVYLLPAYRPEARGRVIYPAAFGMASS
jgi:putative acetyltransferase